MSATSILSKLAQVDYCKGLVDVLNFDDASRAVLIPHIKKNVGVTFILPSPSVAKCIDEGEFMKYYPFHVLPYCFKSKRDVEEFIKYRNPSSDDKKRKADIPILTAAKTKGVTVEIDGSRVLIAGVEMAFFETFDKIISFEDEDMSRSISILKPMTEYKLSKEKLIDVEKLDTYGTKKKVVGAHQLKVSASIKDRYLYAAQVHKSYIDTASLSKWQVYINAICHINSLIPGVVPTLVDPNPFITFHLLIEPLKTNGDMYPYVLSDEQFEKIRKTPCIVNYSWADYASLFAQGGTYEESSGFDVIEDYIAAYKDNKLAFKKLWQDNFRYSLTRTLESLKLVDIRDYESLWRVLNMFVGNDCQGELSHFDKDNMKLTQYPINDFNSSPFMLYQPNEAHLNEILAKHPSLRNTLGMYNSNGLQPEIMAAIDYAGYQLVKKQ